MNSLNYFKDVESQFLLQAISNTQAFRNKFFEKENKQRFFVEFLSVF